MFAVAWTTLGGSGRSQSTPSQDGVWEPTIENLPLQPIHFLLLADGRVLALDVKTPDPQEINVIVIDPTTNPPTVIVPPSSGQQPSNHFCGGHSHLRDGRVLFVGGGGPGHGGEDVVHIYDPANINNPWILQDSIPAIGGGAEERWYPTLTALGNGKVLVAGGRIEGTGCDDLPMLDQDYPMVLDPAIAPGSGLQWTRLVNAQKVVHWYAFTYLLSDQTVLMCGGANFQTVPGADPAIHLDSYRLHATLGKWFIGPVARANDPGGSAVLYRPDKIMKAGAGDWQACAPAGQPGTSSVNKPVPIGPFPTQWTPMPNMKHARNDFYLISMPDGRVLAIGGGDENGLPVLQAEWIDPELPAADWDELASMDRSRRYHSTAILLPDGRILIGGEGAVGHGEESFQLFRPPYLYNVNNTSIDQSGDRPVIDGANTPDEILYPVVAKLPRPNHRGWRDRVRVRSASAIRVRI